MAKVWNWQLGREMEYPYEEARPERQISMVFDLNKCIACQTCTLACKTTWTSGRGQEYMFWNNVETKPYGGYPFAWDMKVLKMLDGGKWEGDKYVGKTIFDLSDILNFEYSTAYTTSKGDLTKFLTKISPFFSTY